MMTNKGTINRVPTVAKIVILAYLCLTQTNGCFLIEAKDGPPTNNIDVSNIPNAVPKKEPPSRYGNPSSYEVNGKKYYVLKTANNYDKTGIASWYGTKFHGQLTSTREPYNMFAMTAASTELPLPTYVRVTNLTNGCQIIVKVNDRGPFDKERVIDLSYAAAKKLGFVDKGTAVVRVTAINLETKPITHTPKIYLQIGAFADYNNADRLRSKVLEFEHKDAVRINKASSQNGFVYRVQIGPLASVIENDRLQQLLSAKGLGKAITVIE